MVYYLRERGGRLLKYIWMYCDWDTNGEYGI